MLLYDEAKEKGAGIGEALYIQVPLFADAINLVPVSYTHLTLPTNREV